MAAASRLLLRAAVFLCVIFLSAIVSMIRVALRNTSAADFLSPPAIALRTDLIAVRNSERNEALWALRTNAWRPRLRACFELAMRFPDRCFLARSGLSTALRSDAGKALN